jgi:hypothetical protein
MIDTLRIRLEGRDWKIGASASWKASFSTRREIRENEQVESGGVLCEHEETGLRVGGPLLPSWAECSLPKLLFGHNGKLLREEHCEAAMTRLRGLVGEVVKGAEFGEASRLDLTGQFAGELRDWNAGLRRVTHKQVRRTGLEFFDSGLVWPGKYLHARLYDKGLEQSGTPGHVVRLEFQTRAGLIPGGVVTAGKIDYGAAYQAYRRFCKGFSPRSVPRIKKLVDLLVWCEQSGFSRDGMTPTELLLASMSVRHQRRVRASIAETQLQHFNIDWDRLVPPVGNPAFVDYEEQ